MCFYGSEIKREERILVFVVQFSLGFQYSMVHTKEFNDFFSIETNIIEENTLFGR